MPRAQVAAALVLFAMGPVLLAQDEIWSWQGDGRFFGASVAGAGDTDGDGHADVLVGDYGWESTRGKVTLFSGATGEILHSWRGEAGWQGLGRQVAGIGDVDGDGLADVAFSAFWRREEAGDYVGRVYAYSGASGELIWSRPGEGRWDYFGRALAAAGDVTGDGIADVIVGADYHDGPAGEDSGKIYLLDGASGELLWSRDGEAAGDRFGSSVAAAGDTDGDGLGDVIAGAFLHDAEPAPHPGAGGNTSEGRAYLLSGASGGLLGVFDGEAPGDLFGFSVSGAGDIDGDDHADVLVGAHLHDGPAGPDSGRIYLFSGATGERLSTEDGPSSQAFFGYALARGGDVNGDGLEELLVGATNGFDSGPGQAFLYSGGYQGGYQGAALRLLWRWHGEPGGVAFGQAVAGAGDVDGDGIPDQVIGDYQHRHGGGTGKVYVVSGNDLYLEALTEEVEAGDMLQVQTRGGGSGAQALLFVVDVNDHPYFLLVARWVLDGYGEWTFGSSVPDLSGPFDVTFVSYTTNAGLADSNRALIRMR
ncbi:MAG: integrin alpha [Planctomycetota bacterium]